MKQFKEYIKSIDIDTDCVIYPWLKETWREALKWILSESEELVWLEEIEGMIKEELKNE